MLCAGDVCVERVSGPGMGGWIVCDLDVEMLLVAWDVWLNATFLSQKLQWPRRRRPRARQRPRVRIDDMNASLSSLAYILKQPRNQQQKNPRPRQRRRPCCRVNNRTHSGSHVIRLPSIDPRRCDCPDTQNTHARQYRTRQEWTNS
jgi:hypothetical protein